MDRQDLSRGPLALPALLEDEVGLSAKGHGFAGLPRFCRQMSALDRGRGVLVLIGQKDCLCCSCGDGGTMSNSLSP